LIGGYRFFTLRTLLAIGEKIDNTKHLINDGNMLAIHSMRLQKEMKSNPKQPSCKKKCAAPKKAIVKKDVKSKVAAKKWLNGRLMAKILITAIQKNLVPNPSEMWRRQHKFT